MSMPSEHVPSEVDKLIEIHNDTLNLEFLLG